MKTPLLSTKIFTPPPGSKLVSRARLINKLNEGVCCRLRLISAPAGFGKSTLLSAWVRQVEAPTRVAWLSLDEGDNDLARFMTYLIAALNTIDRNLGQAVLVAFQTPGIPNTEAILTTLINEMAGFRDDLVLILDDYHVIESKVIGQALTFLLDHLPENMHLVIATRVDPPLPLARLRARRQMIELRTADLRFSNDEAADFLNQVMGLGLTKEDIKALESRTEGWIVGLQLVALSLQERKDPTGFIRSFTGSHHHILDYLVEEVLHQQSSSTQAFLLQTSILERLTGPLCDAVCACETGESDQGDGQATLERLLKSNLFIVPLDDERRWYRYHHLFADLLRHRLAQFTPEHIEDLHNRASIWLEKHGFVKSAIKHALQMENKGRAADLIEHHSNKFLYQGTTQIEEMLTWFDLLPENLIRARPLLYIYQARVLSFDNPFKNKDRINQILAQLQSLLDNDDWGKEIEDTVAGHIASLRGLMSSPPLQPDHDPEGVLALFQDALRLLPQDFGRLRSDIYNGIAYEYMHLEDTEAADKACQIGYSIARNVDNYISAMIALRNQALVAYFKGDLDLAIEICQNGLASFSPISSDKPTLIPGVEILFTSLGYLYVEYGELEKAEIELEQGLDTIFLVNEYEAVLIGHVALIRMLIMKGETEQARQVCEQFKINRPGFAKLAETLQVQVALSCIEVDPGVQETIRGWVKNTSVLDKKSVDFQGITPWAEAQRITHLTWINAQIGLAYLDSEILSDSVSQACFDYLDRQLLIAEEHGLVFRVIESLVYKALVLDTQGDFKQALTCLERALKLGGSRGFIRLFVDLGKPIACMLREAAELDIAPAYVEKLLSAFAFQGYPDQILSTGVKEAPRRTRREVVNTSGLVEPLTDRELEVLRLMADGLTYNEIAGRITVSLNTVRTHVKNIYGKLLVHKRSEAIGRAKELNLL